ncbi:hypothetical protein X797_004359 [Metarhizium robertsii]|uniref:Uncharacterized protein n=2 Tax=Metarhizium robertsii TaxID=568076 RepID=E9ESN2_METRA|nr:uncharacterized protein MAA_02978 [Metarhizium robertsii ARSEF 23]EFZ01749.2 hypothetical protein MAA_02978 [Metarhizium robertsii ARSEF 23]EXV02230.1 hypothetical protein X797_004359 [Metarhizium robertsii]
MDSCSRITTSGASHRMNRPNCPCEDCQIQFEYETQTLTPVSEFTRTLNDDEVRSLLSGFINDAIIARASLKNTLENHGDTIISRWKKMSQVKRRAVLEQIQPPIANETAVDMQCLYNSSVTHLGNRDSVMRKQFLLPWLSINRLTSSVSALFALLHVRTEYHPHEWASFDTDQLSQPWKHEYLKLENSDKSISMEEACYGSIVQRDHDAVSRNILDFPQASSVLEAQAHLMSLLCKIVGGILHGADTSIIHGCSRWNSQIASGCKHVGKVENWSTYINQPFSKPVGEGLDYIISLVRSRREEAEDHFYSLQTKPAYFRQHIKNTCNNMGSQTIADAEARLGDVLFSECQIFFRLQECEQKCIELKNLLDNEELLPEDGDRLRKAQLRALVRLETDIWDMACYHASILHLYMTRSAEFKHLFHDKKVLSFPQCLQIYAARCRISRIYQRDPLACYLVHLGRLEVKQCRQFGAADLVAALERHLQSNPGELKRVSVDMMRSISTIAAVSEARHHLRLFRHSSSWSWMTERYKDEMKAHRQCTACVECGRGNIKEQPKLKRERRPLGFEEAGQLLLRDFYNRPAPSGPKNMARLQESRYQRHSIELFWENIRNGLRRGSEERAMRHETIRRTIAALSVHLTAEYAEVIQIEEASFTETAETKPEPSPFVHFGSSSSNSCKPVIEVATASDKIKTRSTERAGSESATEDNSITEKPIVKKRAVPKHYLEIFHLMFPMSSEERCRTIKWDEFVHSMNHAGFIVSSCGGSAVRFELHDSPDDQGTTISKTIIFHRPHPVPKIDPIMLRSEIGRRLTRRFGWTREHFVLAGVDQTPGGTTKTTGEEI